MPDLCSEGLRLGWDAARAWQALAPVQSQQSADLVYGWLDALIPSIIYIWGSDHIPGNCSEGKLALVRFLRKQIGDKLALQECESMNAHMPVFVRWSSSLIMHILEWNLVYNVWGVKRNKFFFTVVKGGVDQSNEVN